MSEVEKLRALLAEARGLIDRNRLVLGEYETPREVAAIRKAIDAALAEPVAECARCETLRELADTAAAEQGLAQRRMMEAQKQRDEAVAAFHEATRLRSGIQQARIKAENERDEARAALAAELPAAWREDIESLNECLERVGRERDESRAEVERLQAELVRVARAEFDRGAKQGVEQALWASRTAQETAYQRGAEAMREAAASCVGSDTALLQTYRSVLEGRIRDLPVPEDKP